MLGALLLLLMAVAGGGTPHAAAQSPAGIDVLLLVDASSSMKVTDPKDLRVDAGQLFIDLMAPADRVAVVEFSRGSRVLAGFDSGQVAARDALESVRSNRLPAPDQNGNTTDLLPGLQSALKELDRVPAGANGRAVVLLTDGAPCASTISATPAALDGYWASILALSPEFKARSSPIYSIALSVAPENRAGRDICELPDLARLRRLSTDTGGLASEALNPSELPDRYIEVLTRLSHLRESSADIVTLPHSFQVPPRTRELLVVTEGPVVLSGPAAAGATRESSIGGLHVYRASGPAAGAWRLGGGGNAKVRRLFVDLDIRLQLTAPLRAVEGEPFGVSVSVTPLEAASDASIAIEVRDAGGVKVGYPVALRPPGSTPQTANLTVASPGEYSLVPLVAGFELATETRGITIEPRRPQLTVGVGPEGTAAARVEACSETGVRVVADNPRGLPVVVTGLEVVRDGQAPRKVALTASPAGWEGNLRLLEAGTYHLTVDPPPGDAATVRGAVIEVTAPPPATFQASSSRATEGTPFDVTVVGATASPCGIAGEKLGGVVTYAADGTEAGSFTLEPKGAGEWLGVALVAGCGEFLVGAAGPAGTVEPFTLKVLCVCDSWFDGGPGCVPVWVWPALLLLLASVAAPIVLPRTIFSRVPGNISDGTSLFPLKQGRFSRVARFDASQANPPLKGRLELRGSRENLEARYIGPEPAQAGYRPLKNEFVGISRESSITIGDPGRAPTRLYVK